MLIGEKIVTHQDICVFTVMIGDYEPLIDAFPNIESNVRRICFTDNEKISSDHWEIRYIKPEFPMDPIRSQRAIKTRPHKYLSEFRKSLYIDCGIIFKIAAEVFFEKYAEAKLTIISHSFRETLLDEFIEVSRLGLDDQSRIFEQLNHYENSDPHILDENVYWTAIILLDHSDPQINNFSELWCAHVLRYSRRDQLSINWAIKYSGVDPTVIVADNHVSWFHEWTPGDRKRQHPLRDPRTMMMPRRARTREEALFPSSEVSVSKAPATLKQSPVYSLEVTGNSEKHASLGQLNFQSLDHNGVTATFARDYAIAVEIEPRHEVGERWFSIVEDGEMKPTMVLVRPHCDLETSVFLRWKFCGKDHIGRIQLEPDDQGFATLKVNLNP